MRKTAKKLSANILPAPGEGMRGASGHIAYLLRQASAAVRQDLERGFSTAGLTAPQFLTLTMLKAYPGVSGAELARLTLLTPQTVNVITTNLLDAGAIAQEVSQADRRVLSLSLTPHGRALLSACRSHADRVERRLLEGLSREHEAIVRVWLARATRGIAEP